MVLEVIDNHGRFRGWCVWYREAQLARAVNFRRFFPTSPRHSYTDWRQAGTLWLCSQSQAARGKMDVSIDTTHFRLTSRRHGWEQVAECIRQQRIVKLWMHFRDARAEFEARAPYRRERGLLLQGALIVRDALLGSI